jgi:Tol biopolymer transport system component/predicted small lipoprotein YifL
MKKSLPALLVIALLATLLASCGQSAPGQQAAAPTAGPTQHTTSTSLKGRIAWQGFLDDSQRTAAIFSANADGTDVRQLTHPNPGDQDAWPAWSPDGSKIIFTFNGNAPGDIFLMNADGTGLKQLTHCTEPCLGMGVTAWSPDGKTIAYSEGDGPPRPNSDGDPAVAPLWIMQADGSHPVQLTHPPLPTSFADDGPSWSPDGTRLVFERNHVTGQTYDDQALFVINRDGTGLKQLTAWGELKAGNAHWSPDGQRIVFQSFGSFQEGSTPQLYTIFPDGTHLMQLTTNERNTWPAWSPDGTKIIFAHRSTTAADQNAHLYVMNADGSGLVQVTRNEFWQLHPAWGPPVWYEKP